MAYPNGGSSIGLGVAGTQVPAPSFQLVPHMANRAEELSKIATVTSDILRRLRGNPPQQLEGAPTKANAPETATDFGYAQADLTRIIAQNVQEIAGLIG